jgi:hypothetical protein
MKKPVFLFAFLFVSLFASANEVELNNIILDKSEVVEAKEVLEAEDDGFCVTRKSYYFVESFVGMDGETYDVYDVITTTTCY